jgi:anthranilate synthase/aminodeoxychorismate synthase-like glutamine amidotransferase
MRSDAVDAAEVRRLGPQAVVISPGPCTPREAGHSLEIVRGLHRELPMLGICLGHQVIAEALGGRIVRTAPMHGRTSPVVHQESPLFAGIPQRFTACRYHSLVVERASLPAALRVSAETDDGTVMAVEHEAYPLAGVQFHPEAALTEHGFTLLANFLRLAGCEVRASAGLIASEVPAPLPTYTPPNQPVTF